jgi:hypothetical protein
MPPITTNRASMSETPEYTAPENIAEVLTNLIVILLTPMFLTGSGGDLVYASAAAAETLNSYRAETQADLITVAKIIAFGLATLGSLCLSMEDGRSVNQVLRLRSNANATDRSEFRNRNVLEQSRKQQAATPIPGPAIDTAALAATANELQKKTAENLAKCTPKAATGAEQRYAATWAASVAQVAAETAASLDGLPANERDSAALWVDVLNECAKDFTKNGVPPRPKPGDLASLFRGP